MFSLLTKVALFSSAVAQVSEVKSPTITEHKGNLEIRLPRDGDALYSRTELNEVSLDQLDKRLIRLESWKSGAIASLSEKTSGLVGPTTISIVDTTTSVFNATSGYRVPLLVKETADFSKVVDKQFNDQKAALVVEYKARLEEMQTMLDARANAYHAALSQQVVSANAELTTMNKAIGAFNKYKDGQMAKIKDGTWTGAGAGLVAKKSNWCFKWGNGIDDYNPSWKNYPGMTCKMKSETGWMKITIEGRTYGQNHGGLRVVGGGQTYGKDGTYGFQWMNSEHHGHRWLPFSLVRYVQAKKGATIDYLLQHRSQSGGARFHIHGGNYGQQYSGLWWSMEEMADPMSKP